MDLGTKKSPKASLNKLTEAFVNNLQTDFPATVYTIYKISAKIEPKRLPSKCALCSVSFFYAISNLNRIEPFLLSSRTLI